MALTYAPHEYPVHEYWCANGAPILYRDMTGEHLVNSIACTLSWEDHPRLEHLKQEFIGRYGSVPVQLRDSILAGNCEDGTRNWISRHLGEGILSIEMRALVPHLGDERVRRIVILLLRRMGN